jgi:bifunctional DNase/RNase
MYTLVLLFLTGCSNLDVGFEKNSVFHSDEVKQETIENSVVNVYLDTSTSSADKYRLVINGEDTELDLYYDVITRFGIDKKNTVIELLKNNKKVMSIQLLLADAKNYYLVVKEDIKLGYPVMQNIDSHNIAKGTKATPIFVSEEVAKQDKIKSENKAKELHKQKKKDFTQKHSIGVDEIKKVDQIKEKQVEVKKVANKHPNNRSLKERYEAGESIFYYDPNDGE